MTNIIINDLSAESSELIRLSVDEQNMISGGWIGLAIRVAIALAALLYPEEAH
jgi:hypothetical protein